MRWDNTSKIMLLTSLFVAIVICLFSYFGSRANADYEEGHGEEAGQEENVSEDNSEEEGDNNDANDSDPGNYVYYTTSNVDFPSEMDVNVQSMPDEPVQAEVVSLPDDGLVDFWAGVVENYSPWSCWRPSCSSCWISAWNWSCTPAC